MKEKICSECGITFSCGINESTGTCWCTSYPKLQTINPEEDCFCPLCLEKKLIFQNQETNSN